MDLIRTEGKIIFSGRFVYRRGCQSFPNSKLSFHRFDKSATCVRGSLCVSEVRALGGVPALVQLFSSDNLEVQRYATAATRNLIYENADNKAALIEAGGLMALVNVLSQHDEELWKTITGRNVMSQYRKKLVM